MNKEEQQLHNIGAQVKAHYLNVGLADAERRALIYNVCVKQFQSILPKDVLEIRQALEPNAKELNARGEIKPKKDKENAKKEKSPSETEPSTQDGNKKKKRKTDTKHEEPPTKKQKKTNSTKKD
jgi:hypothetical protein